MLSRSTVHFDTILGDPHLTEPSIMAHGSEQQAATAEKKPWCATLHSHSTLIDGIWDLSGASNTAGPFQQRQVIVPRKLCTRFLRESTFRLSPEESHAEASHSSLSATQQQLKNKAFTVRLRRLSWANLQGAWFDLRKLNGNAPIAPLSSQQTAGRLEMSVQEMVGDIGGFTVAELCEAVAGPWAFKFKIAKIWRATDSLRETGVYSLLDHHWLIFRLEPTNAGENANNGQWHPQQPAEEDQNGAHSQNGMEEAIEIPEESQAGQKRTAEASEMRPRKKTSSTLSTQLASSPRGSPERYADNTSSEEAVRQPSSNEAEDSLDCNDSRIREGSMAHALSAEELEGALEGEAVSQAKLRPKQDFGLEQANAGGTWFLRLDRFDTADKWFACSTFENALLTEQAREKHYRPCSDLMLKIEPSSQPLFLDCLTPTLARLANIGYSIFAKGTHCQWHAKVVSCLAASMSHFLDPASIPEEYRERVSKILLDGQEQATFSKVSQQLSKPDSNAAAFIRARPETPYLKQSIQDLKQLATSRNDKISARIAHCPFPDVAFVYEALQCT